MARAWTIGADPACDVVVDLPQVSGRHCRLTRDGDGFLLEDLGSTNGTFVNGERVVGAVRVACGDAIRLGLTTPMPWPEASEPPPEPGVLRIGREPDNDVVVGLPMVSGHHARVSRIAGAGGAVLEDLGSANGTAIGSPERKVERATLSAAETVFLGSHPIPAAYLLARLDPSAPPALVLDADELVIGRDPGCDRVVDLPMVSGRHARLRRAEGRAWIEDLGSANGTFVDGRRVVGEVAVRDGAWIGLGSYTAKLAVGGLADAVDGGSAAELDPIRPPRLLALFAQAPILAAAIAATGGGVPATLWWLGLAAIWFGLADAVLGGLLDGHPLPGVRPASLLRRLGVLAGLGVAQSAAAWAVVAAMTGLVGPGAAPVAMLALASASGLALGLLILAIAPRPGAMRVALPLTLLAMLLMGLLGGGDSGGLAAAGRARAAAVLLPARWAFEGLLVLEAGRRPSRGPDLAEASFPAESARMGPAADALALASLAIGLLAAAAITARASPPAGRGLPAS